MNETSQTPVVRIAVLWALVVIPLAWGVYHTALSAAKLFG